MKQTWDLKRIFNVEQNELRIFIDQLQINLDQLDKTLSEIDVPEISLQNLILQAQKLYQDWYQLFEFTVCYHSIHSGDPEASAYMQEVNSLQSLYQTCETKINEKLALLEGEKWEEILEDSRLADLSNYLQERRKASQSRPNLEMEKAIYSLEADGMHAWADLYQMALQQIKVKMGDEVLPAAKAAHKVYYHSNRIEQQKAFEKWKVEWEKASHLCAKAINHIAGFRLNSYKLRGWDSFLQESLELNRIDEGSVQMMWDTLMNQKEPFLKFLRHKQLLSNAKELSWTDQFSPLPIKGSKTFISYEDGANLIIEHLRLFDEKIGSFLEMVFANQWIDAEANPNKGPGAFCAPLPHQKESRIMLTYENDIQSVGVLAHEIGHAYHYRLLQDLPMYLQDCPQIMAEISSTLFETIVMKAALEQSKNPLEKIDILHNLITRDIGTLLNSYVRHLFEIRFYEERKKKTLSVSELSELMLDVQKEVFDHQFDTYDPTFWASLRHFYFTRKPFGHYPYSIAHLLSTGIYHKLKDLPDRGERLKNILLDTTNLTVVQLVKKHLGEDISHQTFWEGALEVIFENIKEFMEISKEAIFQEHQG